MKSSPTELQHLNFKVSPELHQWFKVTAALRKMSMKDLLEDCARCWAERHRDEENDARFPEK